MKTLEKMFIWLYDEITRQKESYRKKLSRLYNLDEQFPEINTSCFVKRPEPKME